MSDENELLEPLATEAGQQAIARAINNLGSLENAVRAERAATTATQKADEARNSADDASDYATEARNWATKTDGYVDQETITIPPEQEGDEPTTETIDLYSARYYAALAQDIYNNLQFDTEPTENSTALVSSGAIYTALNGKADKSDTYTKTEVDTQISTAVSDLINSAPSALDTLEELANALGDDPNFATTIATQLGNKADKSDTYTKTEVDTALSNVQSTLTFDNVPTANSDNPVKSSGIKTALDGKQDTLTFDSTPTANSTNPVTSGGVYTALQNVNIDIDDEITEDSDNPVTSAAIYEALQNFTPSGGGQGDPICIYPDYNRATEIQELLGVVGTTGKTYTFNNNGYIFLIFYKNSPSYTISISINDVSVYERAGVAGVNIQGDGASFCVSKGDQIKILSNQNGRSSWQINHAYFIPAKEALLSEQMYSNVLYFNDGGVQTGTITLNDDFDNYDFIEFVCGYSSATYSGSRDDIGSYIASVEQIKDRNHFFVSDWGERFLAFNFDLTNRKQVILSHSGNADVFKIIGHKMAKGGYSGIVSDARMTVKSGNIDVPFNFQNGRMDVPIVFDSPMPDANYQAFVGFTRENSNYTATSMNHIRTLITGKTVNGFTLVIYDDGSVSGTGEFDWIAVRPNSYTREGMVEDVLFSNANGVNSGTINLSGNISDYDLLFFDVRASDGAMSRISFDLLSSFLIERLQNNQRVVLSRYHEEYIDFYVTGDNIISINTNNDSKLYKITGIKFGRYVSGVAIDTTVTQNSNAVVTSGAVYDALQNYTPSGGGSSITVDSTITQGGTNPVEGGAIYTALSNKADTATTLNGYGITDAYTKTEVDTALASKGDVTTNTDQNITGTKTFVGSKKVAFKQSTANDKLGFTLYGNTGTERGYLEFNPTNTVDGVTGLMTLGNYATSAASLTQVGFRRYSNISGASGAYNLLMPMVADARTPFSLTTTYQNFYLPLGFTDGTTTVRTAKTGVVDLSPLLASLEARIAALEGN